MHPSKSLLKEFIEGGWLVPLVGAAAIIARYAATSKKLPLVIFLKRIAVAAGASSAAWAILEQTELNSLIKAVTYGIIGAVAPEWVDGSVSLLKRAWRRFRS